MALLVDEQLLQENSRLTAVRLSIVILRALETLREIVANSDKDLIILAVAAILGERYTRGGEVLEEEYRDLRNPFPQDRLPACNISSIAAATGFNRETARRKVNQLIDDGILVRTDKSMIRFRPGFAQQPLISSILLRQVEASVRFMNDLVREDLVRSR
jgi:DNA-binding Lrp family transcriptional regulator